MKHSDLLTTQAIKSLKNYQMGFKNRIINGDMQVVQRGRVHYLENDSDYTIDRIKVTTDDDNAVEVRQEIIYSLDEGSWKDETDPFRDGSQVFFYPLRSDASEKVNDKDGAVNGDVTFNNQGVSYIGDSAYFPKSDDDDYIETPIDSLEDSEGTISILFKITGDPACVIHFSKDGKNTFAIWSNGDVTFNDNIYSSISLENNVWYHMCITTNSQIYINGKKYVEYNKIIDLTTINKKIIIGGDRDNDEVNDTFAGYIQQVRFFNRILTEDEIRKLYVEDSNYIAKTHMRTNLMKKGDTYTVTPYEYRFEGQDIVPLISSKAVLSFNLASNKNQDFTVKLKYPDGSEFKKETISYNGDKEFTNLSAVFDMTELDVSKISLDENLGLILTIGENDELDVGDFIRLTDVQFEVGEIATEFERKRHTTVLVENNAPFNLGIGSSYGYKWINEADNRDLEVTYVNITGKPIMVSVRLSGAISDNTVYSLYVDKEKASTFYKGKDDATDSTMTAIVPYHSEYKVSKDQGDDMDIEVWTELK